MKNALTDFCTFSHENVQNGAIRSIFCDEIYLLHSEIINLLKITVA